MPAAIRRVFGMVDDATAGGSEFDDLVAGLVPDASEFWPSNGGTFDRGITRTGREEEVRGRRASAPPLPFRAEPTMTIPANLYPSIFKKVAKIGMGGTPTNTGTAPAAITHAYPPLGFGATQLPAVNVQLIRDDLNHKMSGAAVNRFSLAAPLDDNATLEVEFWGLYFAHFATAAPTVAFTGLDEEPVFLRDAQMFIDGSMTAVPDLQGFEFSFTNNLQRKPYAKRNVVSQTIGTPPKLRRLWFPAENKVGASQDVTYGVTLGNTNTTQELAHDFGQVQKLVVELAGLPMTTTPVASKMIRITMYAGVHTGGGSEGLTAREDITSRFEGSAFYSDTDASDVKIELVDNLAGA